MVSTRKSTGSLPTPKRKSLADGNCEEDDYSDEEVPEKAVRKRAKKEQVPAQATTKHTRKRIKATHDNEDRNESKAGEGSRKRLKEEDDEEEEPEMTASTSGDVAKRKPGRIDSLITGPESKGSKLVSNGASSSNSHKHRVRKCDMGKLARMMDLPVEVFCEIATHFKPIELLQLSRSSRMLRDFLMSKSSKPIWVACEMAIGMPPCPPDLSEPQYANLYFEKACHACGYPKVGRITDQLRIRLCKGCSKLNVVQGGVLAKKAFGPKVSKNYEIYSLLPWNNMEATNIPSLTMVNSTIQSRYFLKYDFLEVISAYLDTKPYSEERKLFVEKRHQVVAEIAKSIRDVNAWQSGQWWDRVNADEKIRMRRRAQIVKKLTSLGYSNEEIASMRSLPYSMRESWGQLVNQPREVTERIWKNIQPKLEALIQKKKQFDHDQLVNQRRERRKSELLELFTDCSGQQQLDGTNQVPLCFVDLCKIPVVSDLIEEDECSVRMTTDRWKAIEDKLPELIESHSRKVKCDCAALLLSTRRILNEIEITRVPDTDSESDELAGAGADVDTSIVWRANAFFNLYHAAYSVSTFSSILSSRRNILFAPDPWNVAVFQVQPLTLQVADALLSSLGFAEDTTMEHMASLGRSFICRQCDPVLRKRMTWRDLVSHVYDEAREYRRIENFCRTHEIPLLDSHNIKVDGTSLAFIDPNFNEPSVESFTKASEPINGTLVQKYCNYCRSKGSVAGFLYKEQLAAHVRSSHGIDVEPQ